MKIYTDGACRGNPGPAACSFIALTKTGEIAKSFYLGIATNNRAEYSAVIYALKYVKGLKDADEIELFTDSELVVKQLLGEYDVKNPSLLASYNTVMELSESIILVPTHVPRTDPMIVRCDALCNKTLDEESGRRAW